MKKVVILGSTGTIGNNAIRVLKQLDGFQIVGLAAFRNHNRLFSQVNDLRPSYAALIESGAHAQPGFPKTRFFRGEEGLTKMVRACRADIMIAALSSTIGVTAVCAGIELGMRIGLATKELLVSFGDIIMRLVRRCGSELIPIDSEHSAIFQCLQGEPRNAIRNIFLTASGGPFLNRNISRVRKVDVLNHPVWKMGPKITVDSATMMNKGLEIIEAHHLFGLPPEKIQVVIHPEAICHSLVQFQDGSIKAQFSYPDMKLPIQYALTAPARLPSPIPHIDMRHFQNLTFLQPNYKKFPCLRLAYLALKIGKSMPSVLNAANSEAVKLFLDDRLKFNDIPAVIEFVMKQHQPIKGSISDYHGLEQWAHGKVRNWINIKRSNS